MKLLLSVTTHFRYQMKQEKWTTETTEVMLLMKLPLTREKRPFSRSLCTFLFIYLFIVTANFFTVSC